MQTSFFDYKLDPIFIASKPPEIRGETNLLIINTKDKTFEISKYKNIYRYLEKDDLVVLNDTKVIPARIIGKNKNGGHVEIFMLEKHSEPTTNTYPAIFKGNIKEKEVIVFSKDIKVKIEKIENGICYFQFISDIPFPLILEKIGHTPLPPYIKRPDTKDDRKRYQTIFAKVEGSVAAPTASLNFTPELENNLKKNGIDTAYITLHCGYGTFKPIQAENLEDHNMHSEFYAVSFDTLNCISEHSGHVVAVGTTVTRTLEYIRNPKYLPVRQAGEILNTPPTLKLQRTSKQILKSKQKKNNNGKIVGEADIFIYPGYRFNTINKLVTNFHVPRGTPLMLTIAFIANKLKLNKGEKNISQDTITEARDLLFEGYNLAMQNNFKFFSYGDSCLII